MFLLQLHFYQYLYTYRNGERAQSIQGIRTWVLLVCLITAGNYALVSIGALVQLDTSLKMSGLRLEAFILCCYSHGIYVYTVQNISKIQWERCELIFSFFLSVCLLGIKLRNSTFNPCWELGLTFTNVNQHSLCTACHFHLYSICFPCFFQQSFQEFFFLLQWEFPKIALLSIICIFPIKCKQQWLDLLSKIYFCFWEQLSFKLTVLDCSAPQLLCTGFLSRNSELCSPNYTAKHRFGFFVTW